MFSSKSKDQTPVSNAAQLSPPPAQKRSIRSASAPSIISGDLIVNGTLTSTGDIQIDGRVDGDVRSIGLVIGDKAVINGEIFAEDVTVRGRVQGSIRARKVLLCSTCHVEGNILHEAFAVETGAFFEGNCRHADNPLAEEPAKKTTDFASKPAAPVMSTPAPAPSPVLSNTPPVVAPSPALSAMARPMAADTAARPSMSTFSPLKTGN